jgi:hypothetical protein
MHSRRPDSKRRLFFSPMPAVLLACWAASPLCTAHAQINRPVPAAGTSLRPAPASPAPVTAAPPETPPAPATIALANGQLTVSAKNSDLTAILHQVARLSGMSIEGLGKSTRVFGVYGPGSPRDVLTDLLTGADYNFVMVGGGPGGAPMKLVLSEKPTGPAPRASAAPGSEDDSDADDNDAYQEPLGPGAIPHPSPQFTDNTDPQTRAQQNLERLEQMHERILEQEQQQQANPQ